MSLEKMNKTLRTAFASSLTKNIPSENGGQNQPAEDVELTDADLDDVAGGCGVMCGSMHTLAE